MSEMSHDCTLCSDTYTYIGVQNVGGVWTSDVTESAVTFTYWDTVAREPRFDNCVVLAGDKWQTMPCDAGNRVLCAVDAYSKRRHYVFSFVLFRTTLSAVDSHEAKGWIKIL